MVRNEGEQQLTAAYYYCYVRYIMNLYTLRAEIFENGSSGVFSEAVESLLGKTRCFLTCGCDFEELNALREKNLSVLNFVMRIGDWLQIHRYAMLRTGRRLGEIEAPGMLTPESAADELMNFIMEGENPLEVNQRIQLALSELPVRFTKNKFYSVIEDSLKPYLNRDSSDLDKMLQRIRDAAALEFVEYGGLAQSTPADWFPDGFLEEVSWAVLKFERCDYQKLSLQEYRQMEEQLSDIESRTSNMAARMMQLTTLLNDLMAMELSARSAQELPIHRELKETLTLVAGDLNESIESMEERLFAPLEGQQEYFWANYLKYLGRNDGSSIRGASGGGELSESCFMVEQLLSGSFAAPLTRDRTPAEVTQREMTERLEDLFGELGSRLRHASRFTGRAVMAGVLSALPVWFNSLEEVESYIKDSFSLCLDSAEKEACLMKLEQIMVVQNALV